MDNIASLLNRLQKRMEKQRSTSTGSSGRTHEQEYQCSNCQGRGFILDGEANIARICRCQEQKRLERLFRSSRITPAFRAKTFDNFVVAGRPPAVRDMYDCAKDYADRFCELRNQENNWLVLLGEPGSGKTHLSMAVANQLLAQGVAVLYFQHIEGMGELKDALRNEECVSAKLEQIKKATLLVWDDLFKGRERPKDFDVEVAFEVLNYRYLNLLPTVISSERTLQQLLEIDKATGSRIIERGKFRTVMVRGQKANYRLFLPQ